MTSSGAFASIECNRNRWRLRLALGSVTPEHAELPTA